MIAAWAPAVIPTAIGILLVIVPGLAVVWAGWGLRRLSFIALAPAISVSIYAGAGLLAPLIGLAFSALPVVILTVVIALIAFGLRRHRGTLPPRSRRRSLIVTSVAIALASVVLLIQFAWAFISPESIAQRFDNIVHLNTVAFALETANASPLHIGATSGIGFYPNGWHAFSALIAQLSGSDVPTAVNAANLVISAIVWPASSVALAAALFDDRLAATITAGALSTGFGAFPAIFFDWGVLYPNALAYSMLPAALAATVNLVTFRERGLPLRNSLLLLLIVGGMTLAHPNALLAFVLFGTLLTVGLLLASGKGAGVRRSYLWAGGTAFAGVLASVVLWTFARTPSDHAVWGPYQNAPQALGSAILVSPRGFLPTPILVVLLVLGFIAVVRRPRWLPVVAPFIAAVALFVLVSGFPIDHPLRVALTNPWYSDSNRLAALLPIVAIPVAAAGAVFAADLLNGSVARSRRLSELARRLYPFAATALGSVLVFSASWGSSVVPHLEMVRSAYESTDQSLLSSDERALLDRLAEDTPDDALIIGSPRTGTSLAYAIAGRQVTEKHIFGFPDDDEVFLNESLRLIDENPRVCEAVSRTGVDYVLDFGSFDVSGDTDPRGYSGVVDLEPSDRLVLVDEEGDARLFRIEGCS